MPRGRKKKATSAMSQHSFANKLLLNQWIISLFGIDPLAECLVNGKSVRPFHKLAENLRDAPEGLEADRCHYFYHILCREDFFRWENCTLTLDELRSYEENIVAHTDFINQKRLEPIQWKYFQWMALLFTEIYLDRYFRNREQLLKDLNDYVARFNAKYSEYEPIPPYTMDSLNKVCMQNATGSGKTLLMHINVLQFKHYLKQYRREGDLNYTYLLTPNERLSQQHYEEINASNLWGQIYQKDALAGRNSIVLLEIQKLDETDGPKTIATRSLGDNNLLLVDEGHAGLAGKDAKKNENAWFKRRSMLCEKGFSFEYSATFSQAVSGTDHEDDYAKSILFDYSYRWFYEDGYGKDYQIFNIPAPKNAQGATGSFNLLDADESIQFAYLCGALLKYYQQLKLYLDKKTEYHDFNIEKPLWVFAGSSVSSGTSSDDKAVTTDITEIIEFFASFLSNKAQTMAMIEALIFKTGQETGLIDRDNRDFFHNAFSYLVQLYGGKPDGISELYNGILTDLFLNPAGGKLVLERIKGNSGEVMLRVGNSHDPFGLINVSETKKLCDLLANQDSIKDAIDIADTSEYSQSLFDKVKESSSSINLLIGAKKFVEGWDCWRVSTFGLMHVGKTEGAQIIQLFGRGVRLKGYAKSLKRSGHAKAPVHPQYIEELEQLNVFGIEADFMQKFRDYLKDEGLPGNEHKHFELIPLNVTYNFGKKLKVLRPKRKRSNGAEYSFKKDGPVPEINGEIPPYLIKNKVVLDWYPRIDSEMSKHINAGNQQANRAILPAKVLELLDYQRLFFDLEKYKRQQSWYNFNISVDGIRRTLENNGWYELLIPNERLLPKNYEDVETIQRIVTEMMKRYSEKLYNFENRKFIEPRLEYRELTAADSNLPEAKDYVFTVDADDATLIAAIQNLKQELSEKKDMYSPISYQGVSGINFNMHLFQPLFHVKASGQITIMPVKLNDSEFQFVQDLAKYVKDNHDQGEMFLLRNLSSGKGIGFFEASNFHPDFILWTLRGTKQYISFIEPHGILHEDQDSDKMRFSERIKEIETRLGDPDVILNSFILSWTKYAELPFRSREKQEDLEQRHVLFMKDGEDYIKKLFQLLLPDDVSEGTDKTRRSETPKKSRKTYLRTLVAALVGQNEHKTIRLEDLVSTWSILREPSAVNEALPNNEKVQDWAIQYHDTPKDNENLLTTLMDMIERHQISISKDLQVRLQEDVKTTHDAVMDAEYAWMAIQSIRENAPKMPKASINRFIHVFEEFKHANPDFMKSAYAGDFAHAA